MSSLLSSLIGHEKIVENWVRALKQDRLAGVYLFVGPSGVGKKTTAWALAQAYLCSSDSAPCGVCGSCLKIAKKQSESLLFVEPAGQQIKMEQAQEILSFLNFKSWEKKRVIIIDQVQSLHPSAANALLKTLEDPPSDTQFFLIAPSSTSVLPTLRSRCQVFNFKPLSSDQMRQKAYAPEWVFRASRGSFEKLELLQEEATIQMRHEAAQILLEVLTNPDFLSLDSWREALKEKSSWPRFLVFWSYLIRDALFVKLNKKSDVLNTDLLPILEKISGKSLLELINCQEMFLEFERDLLIHREAQLQMESLFVRHHRGDL